MYINDSIENIAETMIKRDNLTTLSSDNDLDINSRVNIGTRCSLIIVILSWYIYGKYTYLCLRGLVRHKNYNFLFPLTATLFAFSNNTNDVFNYIYHASNCKPFYYIFTATATLNWTPISWLQAYRLALISNIYLPKKISLPIITLAISLSITYCYCYFNNLINFRESRDKNGCAVSNESDWVTKIMFSDIADSVFSLASICIIIFKSIKHLRELNTKNEKLNNLVGQGIIELFVIALAKLILYPLINYTRKIPGYDFVWDILSVIVIISAYNLVNFPYEQADMEKKRRNNLRRNVFKFFDSSIGSGSGNSRSVYNTTNHSIHNNTNYIKNDSNTYLSNLSINSVKKEGFNPSYKLNGGGVNGTLFNSNPNLFKNDINGYISQKKESTSSPKSVSPKSDSTFNANNYNYSSNIKNTNTYNYNFGNY